jgi:hypothetical protein
MIKQMVDNKSISSFEVKIQIWKFSGENEIHGESNKEKSINNVLSWWPIKSWPNM